jgi:hypothetical protein
MSECEAGRVSIRYGVIKHMSNRAKEGGDWVSLLCIVTHDVSGQPRAVFRSLRCILFGTHGLTASQY